MEADKLGHGCIAQLQQYVGSLLPRTAHAVLRCACPCAAHHLLHLWHAHFPWPCFASAANDAVLAPDDVYELNQLLDIMYEQRHTAGPRGLALIKNMAEVGYGLRRRGGNGSRVEQRQLLRT